MLVLTMWYSREIRPFQSSFGMSSRQSNPLVKPSSSARPTSTCRLCPTHPEILSLFALSPHTSPVLQLSPSSALPPMTIAESIPWPFVAHRQFHYRIGFRRSLHSSMECRHLRRDQHCDTRLRTRGPRNDHLFQWNHCNGMCGQYCAALELGRAKSHHAVPSRAQQRGQGRCLLSK